MEKLYLQVEMKKKITIFAEEKNIVYEYNRE